MARRCREFVDSRLRRSPPDRASAVPYGQAGENAMRFPRLAHRSAAAHKLHSTPQQDRMNLISGKGETSSRLPAFSLFFPEAVQTTGTVVVVADEHPRQPPDPSSALARPHVAGVNSAAMRTSLRPWGAGCPFSLRRGFERSDSRHSR